MLGASAGVQAVIKVSTCTRHIVTQVHTAMVHTADLHQAAFFIKKNICKDKVHTTNHAPKSCSPTGLTRYSSF